MTCQHVSRGLLPQSYRGARCDCISIRRLKQQACIPLFVFSCCSCITLSISELCQNYDRVIGVWGRGVTPLPTGKKSDNAPLAVCGFASVDVLRIAIFSRLLRIR